jgi:hypothetical protein
VTHPPQVKPRIARATAPPAAPISAGFSSAGIFMMMQSYGLSGLMMRTVVQSNLLAQQACHNRVAAGASYGYDHLRFFNTG